MIYNNKFATLSHHQNKNQGKETPIANKLASLDRQIQKLKQQKEKIETKLALSFLKETERICGHEFSLGSVLTVLDHIWTLSSEIQKEEWKKCGDTFRLSSHHANRKKAPTPDPTHHST